MFRSLGVLGMLLALFGGNKDDNKTLDNLAENGGKALSAIVEQVGEMAQRHGVNGLEDLASLKPGKRKAAKAEGCEHGWCGTGRVIVSDGGSWHRPAKAVKAVQVEAVAAFSPAGFYSDARGDQGYSLRNFYVDM